MRFAKLTSALCAVAFIGCAFAAYGSASAALPEILGTGAFSFTSGVSELTDAASGLVIKCKADKGSGSITSATEVSATLSFEKCNIGGLALQSLGDKGGVILLSGLVGKACYINASEKDVGIMFTLPAGGVHIEVLSLGELLAVTGALVGLISPVNNSSKTGTLASKGSKSCEGETDQLLLELEHSGEPLLVEEVSEQTITFANAVEIMA